MNNNFSRIHCAPFLLPSFVPLLSYKLHLYFMTTGTNIQFLLYAVAFYMGGEIELQTIIHVHCLLCLPLEFPLPVLLISSCRGERVGGEERNRRTVEFSNTLEKWVCVPLPAPPLLLSCLEETSDGDRFRNTLGCSLTSSAAWLFLLLCLSQSWSLRLGQGPLLQRRKRWASDFLFSFPASSRYTHLWSPAWVSVCPESISSWHLWMASGREQAFPGSGSRSCQPAWLARTPNPISVLGTGLADDIKQFLILHSPPREGQLCRGGIADFLGLVATDDLSTPISHQAPDSERRAVVCSRYNKGFGVRFWFEPWLCDFR